MNFLTSLFLKLSNLLSQHKYLDATRNPESQMRTVSNLLHLLTSFSDIPNALNVISNASKFLISSEEINVTKRMMNVQMIASAVKRIGVDKIDAFIHNWIIEEANEIMGLNTQSDTENIAIIGNIYGLLWYLSDATVMAKVN